MGTPVISRGSLNNESLKGKAVLITGAGGGIGFETARSLLWLGAKVAIAEIDREKGRRAEEELNAQFGKDRVVFVQCDIGSEDSVKKLVKAVINKFGNIYALFNNATVAPIGAVHEVGIDSWDKSYSVNLRGPVLLISYILPAMLERRSGVIVLVPSSGAAPYMGAYEVFKTSQVELCNTLSGELEGTGVFAYSIGPGIVKTETANEAIKKIAPLYNKTVEEFYAMNEAVLITPEEAGAGFAASVASAEKYHGMEISSIQALIDAGISIGEPESAAAVTITDADAAELECALSKVTQTYTEQSEGWAKRNTFERQWIIRDFKKSAGSSPEIVAGKIKESAEDIKNKEASKRWDTLPFESLRGYYLHQADMLKGYEKNPEKLKENLGIMDGWIKDIDDLKERYMRITGKEIDIET